MDNLDDLTNDEIRLRLLEHGLPNLPVTSTTRNVLIKKLRNVVNNEKVKNRRETIHVTNYSSADDSDADAIVAAANRKVTGPKNRRATMVPISTSIAKPAAPVAAQVVEPLAIEPAGKEKNANTRRSGRITPTVMANNSSKNSAAPPLIVDLIEESDEDEEAALNSKHRELLKRKPSKSRTPEKQKSTIATTATTTRRSVSKSKEFIPPPKTSKKPEVQKINEEQAYDPYTYKSTYSTSSSKIPLHSWDKYKDIPSIPSSSIKSTYQSGSVGESFSSYSSSYKPYSGGELNYTSKYSADEKEAAFLKDREEEEDGGVALQTPYLNKFSKRLSQLSAEPLLSTTTTSADTYQRRNTESAPARHNIYSYRTSEYQSTGSEIDAWNPSKVVVNTEQKLRWIFWPVVAILIILFLYFMFFV